MATLIQPSLQLPVHLDTRYQRLLAQTAHFLLQDVDADTLCQNVFEVIRKPFQLDLYLHYLVSDDGTQLELASSGGNEHLRAALGSTLQFGQAICGAVALTCEWMYVTSVQQRSDEMTAFIRGYGVRCYTCQPLIVNGKLAGTLSFGSSRRDEFRAEELELFALVAQQVRLATERRLQHKHLRELVQMAAAGRMSATLAHEINNPLDTLSNLMHLLQDEISTTEGRDLIAQANAQIAQLAETSRRTLNHFRGQRQQPARIDVSQLCDTLTANISLPGHVPLVRKIEPALFAKAIPGELQQVLFNLLLNAAQFSPPGHAVTLAVLRMGECVLLSVKDEGPGISESTRMNLFEPFFTTRAKGGTGVGLWVSREMVERVGGTLTFESDPARKPGAEFIVRLPLLAE